MSLLNTLKEQVIVLDGAMGTMTQALDITDEDFGGSDFRMLGDLLSFSKPDEIRNIHLAYYRAGANAVETNTFGACPFRFAEYDFSELNLETFAPNPYGIDLKTIPYEEFAYYLSKRGAELAVEAREQIKTEDDYDGRPLFVFGSIGPSNRVLSSTQADLTLSTFDEIADNFYHQVRGLVDGGVDALLYETQQDILELKAAVFGGIKAMDELGTRVPIIAHVTVDNFGKMQIFNTDIHAAYVTLEGIGIDVFGINCSIGPDLMEKTVQRMSEFSKLPLSIVPNAGLPVSEGGKTVYKFTPEKLAEYADKFVTEYGVTIFGGCCGTTPEHIQHISGKIKGKKPAERNVDSGLYVSGPQNAVELDSKDNLIMIGERLNVRGSKKVREAVEHGGDIDQDTLEEVVSEQVNDLGLTVIDVCMDSNEVDTTDALKSVIYHQTADFPGAMCIDSFAVETLAEAIKMYPGRPVINSISLEEYEPGVLKIDAVMDATRAHDPFYIALCTGPEGPGSTAEEKIDLARQILERAKEKYNVPPERIFVDVNIFPLGSESKEDMNFAIESLDAIEGVKKLDPNAKTCVGIGNLTNGLAAKPYMRKVLTSAFLDEARKRGLDGAIVNPNHFVFVEDLDKHDYELGLKAILEHDMDAFAELEEIAERKKGGPVKKKTNYDELPLEEAICEKIKDGYKDREAGSLEKDGHTYEYKDKIVVQAAAAIDNHEPLEFINDYLMAAMQELGDGFGRGEVSLPHLLKSADVMQQVMGFLEAFMKNKAGIDIHSEIEYKGTVVLGTVYQDVHSIGKDLAKTLLENYGYRVIDLGTMTPLQKYLDTAKEHNADAIGMSALLVQTSNHMITVSQMMKEQKMENIPILIGGAPVNDRHAAFVAMGGDDNPDHMRGNVFYCHSAMDGVNVMNALIKENGGASNGMFEENKKKLLTKLERAQKKAEESEKLLATLPRRTIRFDEFAMPKDPWFEPIRVDTTVRDFVPYLDKRNLFSLNWRFGGKTKREKQGITQEYLEGLFEEWVKWADEKGWVKPQGLCGLFPCYSEGDEIVVFHVDNHDKVLCRFDFTPVIGSGKEDVISGAQYFRPKEMGELDAVGLQITTSGPDITPALEAFKKEGNSEYGLYLQGLSDRIAEDLAEFCNVELRKRMGIGDTSYGTRWSPGYPGMTNMENNQILFDVLEAGEKLGVTITEAGEFHPTGTTAAVVTFHPKARYM